MYSPDVSMFQLILEVDGEEVQVIDNVEFATKTNNGNTLIVMSLRPDGSKETQKTYDMNKWDISAIDENR